MSSSIKRAAAALLLAAIVSACLPSVQPSPLPTPSVLTVQRTKSLAPLEDIFNRCTGEIAGTALVMQEVPASEIDVSQSDLSLRWGAPLLPQGFAAVIGEEELVLIAHPRNPLAGLSVDDVNAIYNAEIREWPGRQGEEIQPWAYPSNEDIQQNFEQAFNVGEPLRENLLYLAPGPAEMIEAVSQSTTALGFIPRLWLNDQVKEIGVSDGGEDQNRFPILSLSQTEPAGMEKSWLLCLQDQIE
jgi:hypothetical protein